MDALLHNIPVLLCFLFGIGLLIVETFLPGFGISGITGALLEIAAVVITWLQYGPSSALILLLIALCVLTVALTVSLRSLSKGKLQNSPIVLKDQETNEAGYQPSNDMNAFLGREGVTRSILRPTGIADFGGVRLDVVTEGDFLTEGTPVRIVRAEGSKIIVQKI